MATMITRDQIVNAARNNRVRNPDGPENCYCG